jgi:hypothetical protein
MASDKIAPLIVVAQPKGVDLTSAGPSVTQGRGGGLGSGGCQGVNPNRVPNTICAERGRVEVVEITVGGAGSQVSSIAPYTIYTDQPTIVGCLATGGGGSHPNLRFSYNPVASPIQRILYFGSSPDDFFFDEAVQFGQTLYDNAGHQYSYLNPSNTYEWQYPAPGNIYAANILPLSGTLAPGTYSYAFTQVVTDPSGAFSQETTPFGNIPTAGVYPYSVTIPPSSLDAITLSGGFNGSNPDGSTYTTNIYRLSTNQPVWYLLVANATGTTYIDDASDASIAGNAQLIFNRDQPPVKDSNLGAIERHKDRMWCFVMQPQDVGGPQSQLWFSNLGRPWEFDAVNNVLLVEEEGPYTGAASPTGTYVGVYGDYPIALCSLSSVMLLHKTYTTEILYGDDPDTFIVRKLFDVGCKSRHSVARCRLLNTIVDIWLSEEGFVMSDGQSYQYIGEPIRGLLDVLTQTDWAGCVGMYAHHAYYVSFPVANLTFGYWIITGEWFGPLPYSTNFAYSSPPNPTTFTTVAGFNEVAALRPGTNIIDHWFAGYDSDLGATQTVTWISPDTNCGIPDADKEFLFIVLEAPYQPGVTASVTLTVDSGADPPIAVQKNFDLGAPGLPIQVKSLPQGTRGYLAQVTVSLTTADPTGTAYIHSVAVYGVPGRFLIPIDSGEGNN